MGKPQLSEATELLILLKNGVWLSGIPAWLFGIVDRSIAFVADGDISFIDLLQLIAWIVLFMSWLSLKPKFNINQRNLNS